MPKTFERDFHKNAFNRTPLQCMAISF